MRLVITKHCAVKCFGLSDKRQHAIDQRLRNLRYGLGRYLLIVRQRLRDLPDARRIRRNKHALNPSTIGANTSCWSDIK